MGSELYVIACENEHLLLVKCIGIFPRWLFPVLWSLLLSHREPSVSR